VCCCCQRLWNIEGFSVEDAREGAAHPRRQSSGNRVQLDSTPAARMTQHRLAAEDKGLEPQSSVQVHAIRTTSVHVSASGNDVIVCNDIGEGEAEGEAL